jgi:ribosomal-protein-alanine N-acetyltransferase
MQHLGTQLIDTPRLLLRRFTVEDAPAMFRNWASDPEVTRFLTWPTHSSVFVTERIVHSWVEEYDKPNDYNWCIEWKETGEPVGNISVVNEDDRVSRAEIGYCISRSLWNLGVMTEALTAVEDYLFAKVGFNRLQAVHDVQNPASGRVMQKSGMIREGVLRAYSNNNRGNAIDVAMWSILRSEWKAMGRG